ncbi:MAG: class I SAM-dependent methyltransferase [Xanthomonadaceae bacterium]|nr:class I SAM-dependent methyltransferase [Xanthomonadaceae bacterium]
MNDWYNDEGFWRTFGPLMFGDDQFSEAAGQVPNLLIRIGLKRGTVLDLGCGPGRHALPLARAIVSWQESSKASSPAACWCSTCSDWKPCAARWSRCT